MYTISECVVWVVLTATVSAFLFSFYVVLLTVRWGIEGRRHTSRGIREDATPLVSPSAVLEARRRNIVD
jgi:hypothetical protein